MPKGKHELDFWYRGSRLRHCFAICNVIHGLLKKEGTMVTKDFQNYSAKFRLACNRFPTLMESKANDRRTRKE
ncbi:hypothetical protein AKJ16_DCAP23309 [Drosera capensis]